MLGTEPLTIPRGTGQLSLHPLFPTVSPLQTYLPTADTSFFSFISPAERLACSLKSYLPNWAGTNQNPIVLF